VSEARSPVDIVERAAAAIRGATIPDPPAELTAATLAAVQLQVAAARRARRRRRIMRNVTLGGLMVCLAVAVGVVAFGDAAQGKPLLRALENQEKAKSFRAVRRVTIPGSPIQETPETRIYHADGKTRSEGSNGRYDVADPVTKKLVSVDPPAKTVRVMHLPGGVGNEHALTSETVRKAIAAKEFKDLGVQVVDGRRLRAYRFEQPAGDKDNGIASQKTYFIDAKRDLLVRTESVGPSPAFLVPTGEPALKPGEFVPQKQLKPFVRTEVVDYLGFDEDLDPALFDQTVPPGYKVEELNNPMTPEKP